jgi:hypothetical protein
MTRLFYDWEFVDTGDRLIGLSLGIVREDGATYYAETPDAHHLFESLPTELTSWLHGHVVPHLHRGDMIKPRGQIAEEVGAFAGPSPRWYGYVDHYDWVLLSQLYGTLVDRPRHWPYGSIDLATLAELVGIDPEEDMLSEERLTAPPLSITVAFDLWSGPPLPAGAHHALAGAIWTRVLWDLIQRRAGDDPDCAVLVDAPWWTHG